MKENKTNAVVAGTAITAAILMTLALSFAIGKWSLGGKSHTFIVLFPSASGISASSEVKLAGAPIGRVKSIKLIPLEEQTQDPLTKYYNSVAVTVRVDPNAQIQEECTATLKQDGIGLSPQYLLFTPGRNHQAKLLEDGATIQGQLPQDITSLVQTAGTTLLKADALIEEMQPAMDQIKNLSGTMNERLPGFLGKTENLVDSLNGVMSSFSSPDDRDKLKKLVSNLDTFAVKGSGTLVKADLFIDRADPAIDQLKTLSTTMNEHLPGLLGRTEQLVTNSNGFISTVGTPEQEEKLKKLISNFGIISDNLKVISYNTRALTATLAEAPWRVVWGGKTIQPPSADQVLKSDKPLPVQDNLKPAH